MRRGACRLLCRYLTRAASHLCHRRVPIYLACGCRKVIVTPYASTFPVRSGQVPAKCMSFASFPTLRSRGSTLQPTLPRFYTTEFGQTRKVWHGGSLIRASPRARRASPRAATSSPSKESSLSNRGWGAMLSLKGTGHGGWIPPTAGMRTASTITRRMHRGRSSRFQDGIFELYTVEKSGIDSGVEFGINPLCACCLTSWTLRPCVKHSRCRTAHSINEIRRDACVSLGSCCRHEDAV